MDFYAQFFDVDTNEVMRRCWAALFPRANFLDVLEGNPDLYGKRSPGGRGLNYNGENSQLIVVLLRALLDHYYRGLDPLPLLDYCPILCPRGGRPLHL